MANSMKVLVLLIGASLCLIQASCTSGTAPASTAQSERQGTNAESNTLTGPGVNENMTREQGYR